MAPSVINETIMNLMNQIWQKYCSSERKWNTFVESIPGLHLPHNYKALAIQLSFVEIPSDSPIVN